MSFAALGLALPLAAGAARVPVTPDLARRTIEAAPLIVKQVVDLIRGVE